MKPSSGVVLKSPIEFALVGPYGSRDRILAMSEDAGLDLVGLAAQGLDKSGPYPSDVLATLFGDARHLNIVSSIKAPDLSPESDSRRSAYIFAWKGGASRLGIERIEKMFNQQLPDIRMAVKEDDAREVEWALGPVIYQCTLANERRLKIRRLFWATISVYIVLGIFMTLYYSLTRFIGSN